VRENEQIPPDHLVDVEAQWRAHLLNAQRIDDEDAASFHDSFGDEVPGDKAECEISCVVPDVVAEHGTVDDRQSHDEDAEADRDPKGSEHGAAIALADVEPTDREPELAEIAPTLPKVLNGGGNNISGA
jgi:hypothetical protein